MYITLDSDDSVQVSTDIDRRAALAPSWPSQRSAQLFAELNKVRAKSAKRAIARRRLQRLAQAKRLRQTDPATGSGSGASLVAAWDDALRTVSIPAPSAPEPVSMSVSRAWNSVIDVLNGSAMPVPVAIGRLTRRVVRDGKVRRAKRCN